MKLSKEEIKKVINKYLNYKNIREAAPSFFKAYFPEEEFQLVLKEMVESGEIKLRDTYRCPNCSQKDPGLYKTEFQNEELVYFLCKRCSSEYKNDDCSLIGKIVNYISAGGKL